jgi:ATP/maltotriose-dependent transcriptional regulator MalT
VRVGCIPYRSEMITALSCATLASGRVDRARDLANQALEVARAHGERPAEALAVHLAGEVHTHGGDVTLAEDRYGNARSLAEDLGMRPLVAHCDLALAGLHRRTGQAELASTAFARAARTLRELEMTLPAHAAEMERARAEPP